MADTILAIKVRESTDLDFFAYSLMQQIIFLASLKKKKKRKKPTLKTLSNKNLQENTHNFILQFLILFYYIFSVLPWCSQAPSVVMCYINLSHILCFSKCITQKFLIKWHGVLSVCSHSFSERQAQEHKKLIGVLWLCNTWVSCRTVLQEQSTARSLNFRATEQASLNPGLGSEAWCTTAIPSPTEFPTETIRTR